VIDRILRFAGTALVAAVAIFFAVHLIESVLPNLIAVLAVVGAVYGVIAVVRYRRSRW
jgi:hypothetical protein